MTEFLPWLKRGASFLMIRENCASDCAKWDMTENCCMVDNIAGRLYATAIPEILNREMKYETRVIKTESIY